MKKISNIILFLLFVALPLSATTPGWSGIADEPIVHSPSTFNLDVYINNITKVELKDIPTATIHLEIYSILGVKVKTINLKKSASDSHYIDLPKGIYILKVGRISQKVVAR